MRKRWWKAWKESAEAIGGFQSRILLGLFYFCVVAPFGIAVRALGDPLNIRNRKLPPLWLTRNDESDGSLDECRRQF